MEAALSQVLEERSRVIRIRRVGEGRRSTEQLQLDTLPVPRDGVTREQIDQWLIQYHGWPNCGPLTLEVRYEARDPDGQDGYLASCAVIPPRLPAGTQLAPFGVAMHQAPPPPSAWGQIFKGWGEEVARNPNLIGAAVQIIGGEVLNLLNQSQAAAEVRRELDALREDRARMLRELEELKQVVVAKAG